MSFDVVIDDSLVMRLKSESDQSGCVLSMLLKSRSFGTVNAIT